MHGFPIYVENEKAFCGMLCKRFGIEENLRKRLVSFFLSLSPIFVFTLSHIPIHTYTQRFTPFNVFSERTLTLNGQKKKKCFPPRPVIKSKLN